MLVWKGRALEFGLKPSRVAATGCSLGCCDVRHERRINPRFNGIGMVSVEPATHHWRQFAETENKPRWFRPRNPRSDLQSLARPTCNSGCKPGVTPTRKLAGSPQARTCRRVAAISISNSRNKKPYEDLGQDYYERSYRNRLTRNLQARARSLGYTLVPNNLQLPPNPN